MSDVHDAIADAIAIGVVAVVVVLVAVVVVAIVVLIDSGNYTVRLISRAVSTKQTRERRGCDEQCRGVRSVFGCVFVLVCASNVHRVSG